MVAGVTGLSGVHAVSLVTVDLRSAVGHVTVRYRVTEEIHVQMQQLKRWSAISSHVLVSHTLVHVLVE